MEGQQPASESRQIVHINGGVARAIYLIAIFTGFMVFYFARSLFLPIALSLVLTLTLSPIVRFGRKRGIAPGFIAIVLTTGLVISLILGISVLAKPIAAWIDDAPSIGRQIQWKLKNIRAPLEAVSDVEKEVDKLTAPDNPAVQEVVVKRPGLLTRVADDFVAMLSMAFVTFGLTTFLLAYSNLFYEKLMHIMPRLSDKKRALRLVYEIEKVVSNYLFTITTINVTLGVVVGLAMWAIGMPTPYLWGIAAASLNFLPYIGSVVGAVLVAIVALVSFDTLGSALIAPITYLVLTTIEGHFVTPMVLGRRLEINPVVVLLSVALWGFVWGIVGVLLAVPIAIIVKACVDHIDQASAFSEFLSAARPTPDTGA